MNEKSTVPAAAAAKTTAPAMEASAPAATMKGAPATGPTE